jgi:hypothetical protein
MYITDHGFQGLPWNATGEELAQLAGDDREDVRFEVACHPNTPTSVLENLANDPSPSVRWGVARHPGTPGAALERMAKRDGEDLAVRLHLLKSVRVCADTVSRLLGDHDLLALAWEERAVPRDHAHLLAEWPDPRARRWVAEVCRDPATLGLLIGDPDASVSEAAAYNEHTPGGLRLRHPSQRLLREEVAKYLLVSEAAIDAILDVGDVSVEARLEIARRHSLGRSAMLRLARDSDATVRRSLATRCELPDDVLVAMAGDSDTAIRAEVARHVKDPDALERLLADPEEQVARTAAQNAATPAHALAEAIPRFGRQIAWSARHDWVVELAAKEWPLEAAQNPRVGPEVIRALAASPTLRVREEVACRRRTPPDVIEALAADPDCIIRVAVARRPDLPEHIAAALKADSDRRVRRWRERAHIWHSEMRDNGGVSAAMEEYRYEMAPYTWYGTPAATGA